MGAHAPEGARALILGRDEPPPSDGWMASDRLAGGGISPETPAKPAAGGKALAIAWEWVVVLGWVFAWLIVGWSLGGRLGWVLRWSFGGVWIRFCNFDRRDT